MATQKKSLADTKLQNEEEYDRNLSILAAAVCEVLDGVYFLQALDILERARELLMGGHKVDVNSQEFLHYLKAWEK